VDAECGCETAQRTGAGESAVEAGRGRAVAIGAVALVAFCLAVLPGAIGLGLIDVSAEEVAAVLGGATLVLVAMKLVALTWAVAACHWPVHLVRLANVPLD